MELTPTGGVIMGTRSGDLDPGVLVYLLHEKQFDGKRPVWLSITHNFCSDRCAQRDVRQPR